MFPAQAALQERNGNQNILGAAVILVSGIALSSPNEISTIVLTENRLKNTTLLLVNK